MRPEPGARLALVAPPGGADGAAGRGELETVDRDRWARTGRLEQAGTRPGLEAVSAGRRYDHAVT